MVRRNWQPTPQGQGTEEVQGRTAAEAKEAKASSKRPRPEEDEVVIVKASRAPEKNFSAEMVKVRAGLKVTHQHGRCWSHQAFAAEKDGPRSPFLGKMFLKKEGDAFEERSSWWGNVGSGNVSRQGRIGNCAF